MAKRRPAHSSLYRVLSALILSLSACTVLAASSAQAAIVHDFLSQFSEVPATGPKGEKVALPGPVTAASSMTVDSGHLWVAEHMEGSSSFRVDEFNSANGEFLAQPFHAENYATQYYGVAIGHLPGQPEPQVYLSEYEGGPQVGVFSESGTHRGTWTGAETPAKSFAYVLTDLAVDNSTSPSDPAAGDVYVADTDNKVIDVFKPEASGKEKYVTQLKGTSPSEPFSYPAYVAVDSADGDVAVADGGGAEAVDIFEPVTGTPGAYRFLRKITATPGGRLEGITGLAIDSGEGEQSGDVYVTTGGYGGPQSVDQFRASGEYLGQIIETPEGPFSQLESVAVDPVSHDVYAGDRGSEYSFVHIFGPSILVPDVTTGAVTNLKARSATFTGTVNPHKGGEATCQIVYGTSTSFGELDPCSKAVPEGERPVEVQVLVAGLVPDTTYHYRLQASNKAGANPGEAWQDREFTTPGPGIHDQSASTVTAVSATLNATIDPHGAPTTYYFQYGTSTAYGSSVPAAPGLALGSGEADLSVSIHAQGLEPATTYHYRVVAISNVGGEAVTVEGADQIFTTEATGTELTQPDGRAWELVTPPNKRGAGLIAVGNEQGADIQAAANGGGITYGATSPITNNAAGASAIEVTQALSRRGAPGRWTTEDVTPPHSTGGWSLAVGHAAEYKLFSNDLSLGFVEPADATPIPPLPSNAEKTAYVRHNNQCEGTPSKPVPPTCYQALVTAENVPPGTKFGGYRSEGAGDVGFVNATPDFSHIVLQSNYGVPFTAEPGDKGGSYVWAEGKLTWLDGYVPEGTPHVISNDGSRVIGDGLGGLPGLELREVDTKDTIQVDAPEAGAKGSPEGSVTYWTANDQASRIFFTSSRRLTTNSTAAEQYPQKEDLYVFELTSAPGASLAGRLSDLTVDEHLREHAEVAGVLGASEDGSIVYFVAAGVLSSAANAQGERATRGSDNLYAVRYEEGRKGWGSPIFIASFSGEDGPSFGNGERRVRNETSRVSPNGRYLAFMSDRRLTGYNNRDANSGVPDEEVFLYDATQNRLVCASCNPTGARPVGLLEGNAYEENLVDYAKIWQGRWFAANIPAWTTQDLSLAVYQSRYLSNSGRLFFNANDALVPADVNGTEDVYEYEPSGVGSCAGPTHGQSASVVYNRAIGGCVGLISAGTSSEESAFMDASESGADVFFLTLSRLVPEDVDTAIDIYDAHECSQGSPCAPPPSLVPPPCNSGDACKPAPTPQPALFGEPASETFSGTGNLKPAAEKSTPPKPKACKRGHVRRSGRCVKAKRKRRRKGKGTRTRRAKKGRR